MWTLWKGFGTRSQDLCLVDGSKVNSQGCKLLVVDLYGKMIRTRISTNCELLYEIQPLYLTDFDRNFNLIAIYYYVVTPTRYREQPWKLWHRLVSSFHTKCSKAYDESSLVGQRTTPYLDILGILATETTTHFLRTCFNYALRSTYLREETRVFRLVFPPIRPPGIPLITLLPSSSPSKAVSYGKGTPAI